MSNEISSTNALTNYHLLRKKIFRELIFQVTVFEVKHGKYLVTTKNILPKDQ